MSTNLKLETAIHLALGLGVGALAASYAPLAVAQDADAQDADEAIEEVIVTGSRIARADIDSASPVTVLSREDIEAAGLTDVGNLLQRMPSMSGSPIGTTTNNGGNGAVLIDLRGMGVNRTLTLINGQRVVDGGDYQTIPSTMIERVEILKDGASAVYGADAVAGVVNIITRRDFEGVEVNVQYADWFDTKAASQGSVGLISGTEWDGGNFVFGAEYVDQEEAYQRDTPWEFFQDSFYIYPEGCENTLLAPYPQGCYRLGSSRIPESRLQFLTQGRFLIGTPASQPYQVGQMIPHDGRNYNYAPVNYLQTPYKRTNLFAEAHFDLTDNVRMNFEMRGNFRESAQELAPMPYNSPTDPAYDSTFNGVAYSGISEQNYYLRRAVDAYNAANGTSLVYEPVRDFRRRMIETTRRFTQDITQYQFIVGLEGAFGDYDWDVFVNQGYRNRIDNDFGQFAGNRMSDALGPSADLDGDGQPECYGDINDPTTLISGCVPFNAFGGGSVVRETGEITASTLTQDMIDYVAIDLADTFRTKATVAGASIAGSNFELPGGALGWAAGYQYWKQDFRFTPDSNKQIDNVTGNTGAGTDGSLTNNAVFGEFLAPLYDNGTQNLYLKGGIRYDDWDAFDGDWTWQLGVEFQALESLKFRGTAGTSFRAPTIGELFAGQVDSFPTYSDPCVPVAGSPLPPGCAQVGVQTDSQVLARVGGNPFLEPETGETYTVGLVWTPQFGDHGFTATLDYWDIQLEDGISSLGVQYILDDCYIRQNAASCSLITRRADYSIAQILDGQINVAEQGAKGVDTEIRWNYASSIGNWEASMLWAHLMERTKVAFPGDDEQDLSGRYTDPTAQDGGAYAENKVNLSLQWMMNDFSVGWLAEYISGLDADTFCNCGAGNQPDGSYIQDIDSQIYHDLVASYTWGAINTTITGGITNLTDEAPPFIETGFNAGTDPPTYRLFGRGYYLRLAWKF
ncbi:MAG: TonB-dependent receptor [Gammaproteobacteria bacterium]|nr:TonB-dependent receptor [Gammaproteobacteria bacterium]